MTKFLLAIPLFFSTCENDDPPDLVGPLCAPNQETQCCSGGECMEGTGCLQGIGNIPPGVCQGSPAGMMGTCACVSAGTGGPNGDPPIVQFYASQYEKDPQLYMDPLKVRAMHKAACQADFGHGCTEFGKKLALGGPSNFKAAAKAMQRGCELGNASGCFYLGLSYQHGLGVTADAQMGQALMDMACDMGDSYGCEPASFYFDLKENYGISMK